MPEIVRRIRSLTQRPALMREPVMMRKAVGLTRGSTDTSLVRELNQALHYAGYLADANLTAFGEETELALKVFQRYSGLPQTGELDLETIRALARPRFDDLPDLPLPVNGPKGAGRSALTAAARYVDNKVSWKKQDIRFSFQNFTPDVTQQQVRTVLRDAFAEWSDVTALKFYEVPDAADVDIRIRFARADGPSGVLATTTWTYSGDTIQRVDMAFDEDETWSAMNRTSGGQPIELFIVAVHEIGHAIGLGHSSNTNAVMYAYYQPSIDHLRQDDIDGIKAKYGGDSTKNVLVDTAVGAPGAAEFSGVSIGWAGTDSRHSLNVIASTREGVYENKVTLGDTSPVGVSLCAMNGRLYMAWSGTGNRRLNVMSSPDGMSWGNKVTLGELSEARPVLGAHGGRLYLGWTGTDSAHHLNVLSSADGVSWGGKHTLGDTAIDAPALASFQGRLYIAWTGTNNGRSLNVMSSADGGGTWQNKRVLGDSSVVGPCLCARDGRLLLAWAGTDGNRSLNVMASTDGVNFGSKKTFGDSSDSSPMLVPAYGGVALVWTGRDARHHLNLMTIAL